MKRSLLVLLFISLAVFSVACGKQNTNEKKSMNIIENFKSNIEVSNDEIFYGRWKITGEIASGTVTSLDNEEIDSYINYEITYTANELKTKEATLRTPYYQKVLISESQFFQESYVRLDDIELIRILLP
ncbi:hypothetical protein [Paenibacillus radicis (ex Gao et al. 2016)]|uniref:Uncharacterized protein n=1 Tax=Paenibacillus radicis (ex Gao et al. 2016) TaxID=1737354 RepID=A0A917HCR2_9BACL|nr:hypothetical protein [Paenibacillus radicis (ex Gao et al. 2016)]GGG75091.1 hypothetical protein GCM10010918_34120 [Paenibacillus radicis (ex Gao et al. 2016)]